MKINKIGDIEKLGDSINVMVNVEIDPDEANKWELTNPVVSVRYTEENGEYIGYMEMLSEGMSVHGYELSTEEEKKISDYLNSQNIIGNLD